jgi:hypothetical protein
MPINISDFGVLALLKISAAAQDELRSRGITRTANTTGDYAEYLFSQAYGWTLENNSKAGFDAHHLEAVLKIAL